MMEKINAADAADALFTVFENTENFVKPGDYQENGLWYCGICHTPKQCRVEFPIGSGKIRTPFSACQCDTDEEERFRQQRRQEEIERKRQICFPDYETSRHRFENDDGKGDTQAMQIAKNYVQNFEFMYHEKHVGLLFYGDTGVGKSFTAACIANALIEKGYSCYMTCFSDIVSGLWDAQKKGEFLNEFANYDLLVIDDFGAERNSEYVDEIVTNVIDARCRNGKPVIVTTNLNPEILQNPQGKDEAEKLRKRRVYSRLQKMTIPVEYIGTDKRTDVMKKNFADVRHLLGL